MGTGTGTNQIWAQGEGKHNTQGDRTDIYSVRGWALWKPQGAEFGNGRPPGRRLFRDPWWSRELGQPWQVRGLGRPWWILDLGRPWRDCFRCCGSSPQPGLNGRSPTTPPPLPSKVGARLGTWGRSGRAETWGRSGGVGSGGCCRGEGYGGRYGGAGTAKCFRRAGTGAGSGHSLWVSTTRRRCFTSGRRAWERRGWQRWVPRGWWAWVSRKRRQASWFPLGRWALESRRWRRWVPCRRRAWGGHGRWWASSGLGQDTLKTPEDPFPPF